MRRFIAAVLLAPLLTLEIVDPADESSPSFSEIDATVAMLIRNGPAARFQLQRAVVGRETSEPGVQGELRVVEAGSKDPLWWAAINITSPASNSEAHLRVYTRISDRVTLVATSDDTALMHTARREKGLEGRGNLGWCLQYRISEVSLLNPDRVRVSYEHVRGG